jgi:hypothetical protein
MKKEGNFMRDHLTRRGFMATAGALALSSRVNAADTDAPGFDNSKPTTGVVIPAEKVAEMNAAPLIVKTVNRLWNDSPSITEPNAMQFTPEGTLLLLNQVDPNNVFEVQPKDGRILRTVQTESVHGSGITMGDGAWWITSTKALKGPPVTLKVDPKTGQTLKKWITPGWGLYGNYAATGAGASNSVLPAASGGHDVKWAGSGRYWMAVPSSGRIFLMEAETGEIVRSIQAPVIRTHGLAIEGDYLWSVASDFWQILKIAQKDGRIVAKIQLDKSKDPEIHGLELKDGVLWYCDASKGWICNLT